MSTKLRFRPIFGGWTQFSNLLDKLESAENLRFCGPFQLQIAEHFRRSSVLRELNNKTWQVPKVCWIQFTAVWHKPQVLLKTNRRAVPNCDNPIIIEFSKNMFCIRFCNLSVLRGFGGMTRYSLLHNSCTQFIKQHYNTAHRSYLFVVGQRIYILF